MFYIHARSVLKTFICLSLLVMFAHALNASEKDDIEDDGGVSKKQGTITQYFRQTPKRTKLTLVSTTRPIIPSPPKMALKPKAIPIIDLTKDTSTITTSPVFQRRKPTSKPQENPKASSATLDLKPSEPQGIKRASTSVDTKQSPAKRSKDAESEMQVRFLHGKNAHITNYAELIQEAEAHIIIASWNVNFISEEIFWSLLEAKRRGVNISFVVNSVVREKTLDYFTDFGEEDDYHFDLFKTKSHAKFIFVDSKSFILGSFNALGESYEESDDASFMIKGTVKQLWPFYMSIYETYTSIGEDLGGIFDGIAMISKVRNPGERRLLQRSFKDGSQIFLLRTIKEHEDFFRLATPNNGKVSIFSPFSTKDNTLKRLQKLESLLKAGTEVHLSVLQQYESGLKRLLDHVPSLKIHAHVHVAASHQKIIVLGDQTICVGSLNWLSAAQDAAEPYSNVELSIVLQGPKAEGVIRKYYG